MSCIKCGKDTEENNVFCKDCLDQMDNYPVKPGTPVLIPDHIASRRHAPRRPRAPEPEEVIRRQKRIIRLLSVAAAVLLVAWGITVALLIQTFLEEDTVPIGQNFGITTTDQSGT